MAKEEKGPEGGGSGTGRVENRERICEESVTSSIIFDMKQHCQSFEERFTSHLNPGVPRIRKSQEVSKTINTESRRIYPTKLYTNPLRPQSTAYQAPGRLPRQQEPSLAFDPEKTRPWVHSASAIPLSSTLIMTALGTNSLVRKSVVQQSGQKCEGMFLPVFATLEMILGVPGLLVSLFEDMRLGSVD